LRSSAPMAMTVAKMIAPKNVIIAAVPSWRSSGSDEAPTPSEVDTAYRPRVLRGR
jgi:hypothetical protein